MRSDLEASRKYQVTILYLLYPTGPSYQRERPILELKKIAARLPGRKSFVYIDNSIPNQAPRLLGENEFALGGDNTYLEFSGWQKGLQFARERDLVGDVCLFANDTFMKQSVFHRRLVNAAALRCSIKYDAMLGKRMVAPVAGEIFGNQLIPYIRTHLFMLPGRVLERLSSVVSLDSRSIDQLFLGKYDPAIPLFRADAPVSISIRDFVTSHLHSSWYRKMPYTAEHFDELRAKAISILNAFLLSIRVYQRGYPLVSYPGASAYLRDDLTPQQISADWCGSDETRGLPSSARNGTNRFWAKGAPMYRGVPEKMRSFTLENILDYLERRSHPEHL
jgi:hypothetical protein